MNKLANLLVLAESQGIDGLDNKPSNCSLDGFINDIRPYVFSYDDGSVIDYQFEQDEIPSLPFPVCSIELDGDGAIFVPDIGAGEFWIISFLCREISPGNYDFYVLGSVDGSVPDAVIYVSNGYLHNHLLKTTVRFIKRLRTEQNGLCRSQIRIKRRLGSKKAFTTIKGYVYVNKSDNRASTLYGEKIEYSHAFEVCGHWRKIKGVGLDRLGQRIVEGATWIKPFIKGNAESDPLVKTRYVR